MRIHQTLIILFFSGLSFFNSLEIIAQTSQYGICHLNIIPVRTNPGSKNELCTQLIFGDTYTVLEANEAKTWIKIQSHYDDYQGWMEAGQYFEISAKDLEKIKQNDSFISNEAVSWVNTDEQKFPIVLGSTLPFFQNNQVQIGAKKGQFEGKSQKIKLNQDVDELIKTAYKYLKTPYLWGGKTLFGTDCSGFTQTVFKVNGFKLKRDAYQQAEQGDLVTQLSDSKTGDLAFFERNGRIIHVGIIIEGNRLPEIVKKHGIKTEERLIIHALDCVRIDKLDTTGIYNLDRNIYTHNLKLIKQYFKPNK
jgi:cell wall-associated NlpC family hydrolase